MLTPAVFAVAFLYSSVGHAGASGYIAAMALFGLAPEVIRPTALALNMFALDSIFLWGYVVRHYYTAFPDIQVKVENLIAEGDKVVSHVISHGTHKGELMGIAPTGKQVTVPVICISRFEGDKIVEDWEIIDLFGMLQQLDVIPSPGQK